MFNLGGGEVLVILLLALVVLGPTRLPDAAKQVGRFMGEVRKLSTGFQNEMKHAFDDAEIEAQARKRGAAVTVPGTAATPSEAAEPAAVAEATAATTDLVVDPPAPARTPARRPAGAARKRTAPLRARPAGPRPGS